MEHQIESTLKGDIYRRSADPTPGHTCVREDDKASRGHKPAGLCVGKIGFAGTRRMIYSTAKVHKA